jgi:hypothetical protein
MECPRCEAEVTAEDNFCRKCGYILGEQRALVPVQPPSPPINWQPVRDLVIRGATALAVGTAAELVRRQARRHLNPAALADRVETLVQRRQKPARREPARVPVRVVKSAAQEPSVTADDRTTVTVVRYAFFQRIRIRR